MAEKLEDEYAADQPDNLNQASKTTNINFDLVSLFYLRLQAILDNIF